jgi:hypothetical protein
VAHVIVLFTVASAFAGAVLFGRHRQRRSTRMWFATWASWWRFRAVGQKMSLMVWIVLIGGAASWDLVSFIEQSHRFPTLSYFIGHITKYEAGRGLLFALWLALGIYLALAGRSRAEEGR